MHDFFFVQLLIYNAHLFACALHDTLGDNEDLVDDLGLVVLAQRDQQHTKVRAAQIERQNVVRLRAGGQLAHKGGQHLHLGLGVRELAQALVHLGVQDLHDLPENVIAQLELVQSLFDLLAIKNSLKLCVSET